MLGQDDAAPVNDHARLHVLREECAAGGHLADRLHERRHRLALRDVARGPHSQRLLDVAVVQERAQEDDAGLRPCLPHQPGRLETRHARHVDVHDDDVGLPLDGEGQGLAAVAAPPDDPQAGLQAKLVGDGAPHECMIVHDKNTNFGTHDRSSSFVTRPTAS